MVTEEGVEVLTTTPYHRGLPGGNRLRGWEEESGDRSENSSHDGATFSSSSIDEEAPFLLRPPGDDPDDARNWVVKAIERTGQSLDEALHTWIVRVHARAGAALRRDRRRRRARRRPASSAPRPGRTFPRSTRTPLARPLTGHHGGATVRPRARDRAPPMSLARTGHHGGGGARLLEPRVHGARPSDVAVLGGPLRGARGPDHVLPRLGADFALGFLDAIKAAIGMEEFETTDDLAT